MNTDNVCCCLRHLWKLNRKNIFFYFILLLLLLLSLLLSRLAYLDL